MQVLVSIALLGGMAMIFASMISQQHKQMHLMEQKSEVLDIKNQLMKTLGDAATCQCAIGSGTFNSTVTDGSAFINVNNIQSSCTPGSPAILTPNIKLSSGLVAEWIHLSDLKPSGNPNEWLANWTVHWLDTSLAGPLKDTKVRQVIYIDPASPAGSRKIQACSPPIQMDCQQVNVGCMSGNPDGCNVTATCPIGYKLTGCWNEEDGGSIMQAFHGSGPNGEDQCSCHGQAPSQGKCWSAEATCCRVIGI